MRFFFKAGIVLAITVLAAAAAVKAGSDEKIGLLLMAHGGEPEWNQAVDKAVAPLRTSIPVAVAFGMADPRSLQAAIDELEMQGIRRIAVVGLFISANSFRHQTEYLLGLRNDPPVNFVSHPASHAGHAVIRKADPVPKPVQTRSKLVLNRGGLYDAAEVSEIFEERVKKLSRSPRSEAVLILAHGADEDADDREWRERIERHATRLRNARSFAVVKVETLREDWMNKRRVAERRIRGFVSTQNRKGRRVLVVPFRLFGFGPYREVLKGLSYEADGMGMLPHPLVTHWIQTQAEQCFLSAGWNSPFEDGSPALGEAN
ncbi:MAG: hypothetical protein HY645_09655 [Acidobacteria bacterium]|nr:hypothetical protein [Acidobacteriota bacterium]